MADIEASRVGPQRAVVASREAGLRCRSAQPLSRRRGGRPPRHHPRRRPLRAAVALPVALRAARRRQVLAGRPLRLSRLARRLGRQVRPLGLKPVAEVRAGINLRNIAVSADGRWVMVGNFLPATLVVLDAGDLRPVKVIPVDDGKGARSRVSAVYTAPPRSSFLVALKDLPQLWEISTRSTRRQCRKASSTTISRACWRANSTTVRSRCAGSP